MSEIIASSVSLQKHIAVFDDIAAAQFGSVDLTPVMIYLIDTCPAAALPFLAEQFNVLGYKGWYFANTDAQKRALLKQAIQLNKYKGTPWAITTACALAGFTDIIIQEHLPGVTYNGQYNYNGTINYDSPNWACFSVLINLGNNVVVDVQTITDLTQLVLEYKNARSWLWMLAFGFLWQEIMFVNDTGDYLVDGSGNPVLDGSGNYIFVNSDLFTLTVTISFTDSMGHLYDGSFNYDGSINYNADYGDNLTLTP